MIKRPAPPQGILRLFYKPPRRVIWGIKKLLIFGVLGFQPPVQRAQKGEPALGGSGMAIFDLLGAGFLVIFLYHRGPGAVCSELGIGEGIIPE